MASFARRSIPRRSETFRYLVSGGVSLRALVPAWTFGPWVAVERALTPWMDRWAMFAFIVLRRLPQDD